MSKYRYDTARIERRMRELGLSRRQLSRLCNLSDSAVSQLLRRGTGHKAILAVAGFLKIPLAEILIERTMEEL